ncbi:histidine phosphatase family protein [Dehalobacter sp. DCM]|uniref:histidine phosphatase family protein n=1 Tax=Dehalobacter sp. DCM TaxID=2907827 RepID=UPI0030821F7C|nr:histidine phosphatase family protein [Dehalobacter sp. DCM]
MEKMIFLIRHAEPLRIDDQKRYLGGQSDPDLSLAGREQAERLAEALKAKQLQTVFSSDLHRAEQTAAIVAAKSLCSHHMIDAFREINMGKWEGKSHQEIREAYPDDYCRRGNDLANFQPPEGESLSDLQRRVLPAFLDVVKNTDGNLAIVAHAGVNRVILCHLMALPLQQLFIIEQNYAGVSLIRVSSGSYQILEINQRYDDPTS